MPMGIQPTHELSGAPSAAQSSNPQFLPSKRHPLLSLRDRYKSRRFYLSDPPRHRSFQIIHGVPQSHRFLRPPSAASVASALFDPEKTAAGDFLELAALHRNKLTI